MQIHKEKVSVIFREAHSVDLHYALQVIGDEFAELKGLLHCFAFFNHISPLQLKGYALSIQSFVSFILRDCEYGKFTFWFLPEP